MTGIRFVLMLASISIILASILYIIDIGIMEKQTINSTDKNKYTLIGFEVMIAFIASMALFHITSSRVFTSEEISFHKLRKGLENFVFVVTFYQFYKDLIVLKCYSVDRKLGLRILMTFKIIFTLVALLGIAIVSTDCLKAILNQ